MARVKPLPRSLFKKRAVVPSNNIPSDWMQDPSVISREELVVSFGSATAIVVPSTRGDDSSAVKVAIQRIERRATESVDKVENGDRYLREVRARIVILRRFLGESNAAGAAWQALKLGELWGQIESDRLYARTVRAAEKQRANLRQQKAVTDDQILDALSSCRTKTDAAKKLGISTRQLQNRQKELPAVPGKGPNVNRIA